MAVAAPIIGQIALNLAIGVGASVLSNALRPQSKSPARPAGRMGFTFDAQVGEAVKYSAVFGIGRARGALHYVNEYGEGDGYHLQLVYRVGIGEHDGLETFLVDEKPVTLAGSNADAKGRSVTEFTVSGTPHLWVKSYTGEAGQTADAELIARSNPSGRWTSNSTMTGWAYLIVTVRYHPDLFGSTLPRFGSVWRGLKLCDFHNPACIWGDPSTYVFTKNPAVIRWNYRRGIWVNGVKVLGQGFSAFANDFAYYTAAANVCDELVEYPETEEELPRYEFGREVSDDEEHLTVLQEIDASYAGSSFKRGGADAPLPGQQLVSVMTLTDGDRLRGQSVRADRKGSVSVKKTEWHGQYVSAAAGYALAPYEPRINTTMEGVLGGRRATTLDQPYERVEERAQARAEIALRRQMFPATRVETFTPRAFALEPGDLVTRVCEWGSISMIVESTDPLEDRTGVRLTLTQWSNTIVPASGEEFITLPGEPGPGPADPVRTIAVSGLTVVAVPRSSGGAVLPYAKATWSQITDPNVDQVMIRYWPTSGTETADGENVFANAALQNTNTWGPLTPETEFTGYAIPIRKDGRLTVPTNPFTFTSGALAAPLADGSIDLSTLADDLLAEIKWIGQRAAAAFQRIEETGNLLSQQDLANAADKQQLVRSLEVAYADLKAGYLEAIEVAVGPSGALAQKLESLYLALGGSDQFINVFWDIVSGPTGYTRYSLDLGVGGDDHRTAGLLADVPNNPLLPSRLVLRGDQVVVYDGVTVAAMFDAGMNYFNNALIAELTATNIQAGSITASCLNVSALSAITADLGTITAGTITLGGGKLVIDGPNSRILVAD